MPTPDVIQGVDLPLYSDPANIPDDLAAIYYALLSRGIPRFSTIAQRDAAYPSPTNGQVVYVSGDRTLYLRDGGSWQVLWRSMGMHYAKRLDYSGTITANGTLTISFDFPTGLFTSSPAILATPIGSGGTITAMATANAQGGTVTLTNRGTSASTGGVVSVLAMPVT